jgi:transcriptional regulator with XRE-family HTH domain
MYIERLKLIREKYDYSQRDMAKLLKISKSNYARWETGEKIVPLKHLINICNVTNSNIDYILDLDKENKSFLSYQINNKYIGRKIKRIRLKNNLTQRQFADIINTTQSVISSYENGITTIQTAFLYEICIKFAHTANYFFN